MKTASKLLHILAILGAIGSAALYYLSNTDASTLSDQLERSNGLLSKSNQRANQLSDKNDELLSELEGKTDALEEARANITVLATRNTQLKRETQRFTEELETRVQEQDTLQQEIVRLNRENAEVKASTVDINEVQDYTRQITALQEEILQLQNSNARFPGTAANTNKIADNASLPDDLKGKILTVGPQSSFVILNLGYENGIRLTHSLSVARGTETIAHVEITEVKEKLSIARILPESLKLHIQEGDIVSPL